MIIINTGNGKGKTTAAIGQTIRSLGQGFKVCIVQLFKDDIFYGEQKILVSLNNLDFFAFAKKHPYFVENLTYEEVKQQCDLAVKKLHDISSNEKEYDLIVLEEFNIAINDGFIDINEFIIIVQLLSQKSNIVITGRNAPQILIDMADLVTEMKDIKHPYSKGILAKKGVEF
jgi:cob(I)alamin adenosyltransferase